MIHTRIVGEPKGITAELRRITDDPYRDQGKTMIEEKDRVREAREQYEAMQARQKRVQDARKRLEKPGVLLKLSIVLVGGLLIGLGFFDPIFRMLGFHLH